MPFSKTAPLRYAGDKSKGPSLRLVFFYVVGQASLHFPVYFVVQNDHTNAHTPLKNKQKAP